MDSAPRERLNWGCGPVVADGWVNVDRTLHRAVPRDRISWATGVEVLPHSPVMPYEWTDRFDVVVANHSLQCLDYVGVQKALEEFARVLAPGGWLRILVPDVVGAVDAYEKDNHSWPGFTAISEPWDLDRKFAHYLTWGGQNRSCFTRWSLICALVRVGFSVDDEWSVPDRVKELDSRLGESLIVTGWKQ